MQGAEGRVEDGGTGGEGKGGKARGDIPLQIVV